MFGSGRDINEGTLSENLTDHPHLVRFKHRTGLQISIHVPARGTTPDMLYSAGGCLHFNPRTRTGYRPALVTPACTFAAFQSTYRTGYDVPARMVRDSCNISIHVPARGTTFCGPNGGAGVQFQSTYPHGVRTYARLYSQSVLSFQSTYPHGVRPAEDAMAFISRYFNPRTRTGYDIWQHLWFGQYI